MKLTNQSKTIMGTIAGDVIGSVYEWHNVKTTDFPLYTSRSTFTDDTILSVAVADCIVNEKDFAKTIWEYGNQYPGRGFGGRFKKWLASENPSPYDSFGNGSAMRVSPVGFAFKDIETVLEVAKQSAVVSHSHAEGVKGAQAVAAAVFLAHQGQTKADIKTYITTTFAYDINFTLDEIRPNYKFDVTCQGSVPQAIVAFLESSDYENAIRLAISIGGDSDTIAAITGGIAAAFYKEIPSEIYDFATSKLPDNFIKILNQFEEQFI